LFDSFCIVTQQKA